MEVAVFIILALAVYFYSFSPELSFLNTAINSAYLWIASSFRKNATIFGVEGQ